MTRWQRAAWRAAVAHLDPEQFVFVDESWHAHRLDAPLRLGAPRPASHGRVPRNHGTNTTLVAALTPDGLHVPWLIEGAMDTETFAWYIAEQLAADAAARAGGRAR